MSRGVLVAFEGIDGSGKSTQAHRVASERNALFSFEPGDTAIGASLRSWLLDARTPLSPEAEALFMLADRAHHVDDVIAPALNAGRSVVTDRYYASTLAYQGYGRGLDLSALWWATTLAVREYTPQLTILMDLPVEVARARRGSDSDRFESAGDDFLRRVREGFLDLAATDSSTWLVIDASADQNVVSRTVDDALNSLEWPT